MNFWILFLALMSVFAVEIKLSNFDDLQNDRDAKLVVFAETNTPEVAQVMAEVAEKYDAFKNLPLWIVSKEGDAAASIWEHFKDLPFVFTQLPGNPGPSPYTEPHTTAAFKEFFEMNLVEPAYELVKEPVGLEEYQAIINAKDEVAMVAYAATWCGHCKALTAPFARAAGLVDGAKISFVKVFCDKEENKTICSEMGIRGYPTIKMVSNGKFEDYQGARTTGALKAAVEKAAAKIAAEVADEL